MDYSSFCQRAQHDWQALEELLERVRRGGLNRLDHEELERFAAYHRRAVSDFAYARTHFPRTDAVRHLRSLAFAGHRLLGAQHEAILPRMREFFFRGYRRAFREALPALATALSIFLGATALGFVVTLISPGFAALFLGADAIENLRQGQVWTDSVGSIAPPAAISGAIFTNNMTVALVTWLGGALFGLLTVVMLLNNGLMFGSVLALTWQYHLLDRLLAFISAHGPLELFLIVVAGAAGFQLARGQIRAKQCPPGVSFRRGARRSLRLVGGTLPWFVLLGLVEGFLSPVMTISTWIKALLGVILLASFLAYALAPPTGAAPNPTASGDRFEEIA